MNSTKILSAPLIDIVFDGRNKDYGAYALRKTYSKRMLIALFVTVIIVTLAFGGAALGRSTKKKDLGYVFRDEYILKDITVEKKKEPIVQPKPKQPVQQVKTITLTPPAIVDDINITKPLAANVEFVNAAIGTVNTDGITPDGTVTIVEKQGKETGIIDDKPIEKDPPPFTVVEVAAKFSGNWINFLLKNLNANVPVDNNAPVGTYSVIIQFVVDREGFVSEVKALTNQGFGMEEEALRVIKKASKWEPAIQNGYKVKAYHKQVITFQVLE